MKYHVCCSNRNAVSHQQQQKVQTKYVAMKEQSSNFIYNNEGLTVIKGVKTPFI